MTAFSTFSIPHQFPMIRMRMLIPKRRIFQPRTLKLAITFVIGSSLEPCSFSQEKLLKERTSMKRRKRVRKAKKRKMIRILTPPKLNLVNRNASNNKESINDFIEHFDTKLYWIINEHHQNPKNFSSKGNTLKILSSET